MWRHRYEQAKSSRTHICSKRQEVSALSYIIHFKRALNNCFSLFPYEREYKRKLTSLRKNGKDCIVIGQGRFYKNS